VAAGPEGRIVIVLEGRKIPPTREQVKAAFWARVHRYVRAALWVCAVLAPITLALALWQATRTELGWAVTLLTLDVPLWVAAYARLTDAPAVEMPR
jgi:hypothetical protein